MPIYEYKCSDAANSCDHCVDGFDVLAKVSDAELTQCPICGLPVRRVISAVAVVGGNAHLLKENHFANRGFTQYKKVGGGVYEKTAGDGPRYISDDGK
jgi:putative FmdB family regulatory protein